MWTTICDFCKNPTGDDLLRIITISNAGVKEPTDTLDCCHTCFQSSVILSESRRVKRLRPAKAAKRNRKAKVDQIAVDPGPLPL